MGRELQTPYQIQVWAAIMPRSTREYLLRYADQALADYDRALNRLGLLSEAYGETHPAYKQAVENLIGMTVMVQETLRDFRQRFM